MRQLSVGQHIRVTQFTNTNTVWDFKLGFHLETWPDASYEGVVTGVDDEGCFELTLENGSKITFNVHSKNISISAIKE